MLRVFAAVAAAGLLAACSTDPAIRKQRFLDSGNAYAKAGKVREAIVEYRNAVQIDPRFAEARVKLAAAYAGIGDSRNALSEYVRAADLLPNRADVQVTAGSYLLAAKQMDAALQRADQALKLEPGNAEAHVLRGNALAARKDLDAALAEIEEAIRLDPSRSASYAQLGAVESARGRQAEAEQAFKKAVALAPEWVGGQLALATHYWMSGRLAEAEASLTAALRTEPTNLAANRAMALFTLSVGRAAEAEQYLTKIVDIAKTPESVYMLADYYSARGRTDDAVKRVTPLTTDPRTAASAKLVLSRAYATAGQRGQALELVNEVIGHEPKNSAAHLLKGQLLVTSGRRDEALVAIRAATDAEPESAAAQFALGRLYAARGDMAAAEKAFTETLKLNPRATAAQVELSKLQLSSGRADVSLRNAEAAAANEPESLQPRLALVRSLVVSRQHARAKSELATLASAYPNVAEVHVLRGILAAEMNDATGARAALDKALELDPASTSALAAQIGMDLSAGRFDAAKARVDARVKSANVSGEELLLAARTYASAKDLAGAESYLRRAIEAEPTLLPAYAALARMYLSQRKLDQARKEFDVLAERQTEPVAPLTMSGIIAEAQGDKVRARERYERALAVNPQASVAANNLAWMLAENGGNIDRALQLAQSANAAEPEAPEIIDTLGWVYYKKNVPDLAVRAFQRCVEKSPSTAQYHYHLGLAYVQAGNASSGRKSLERALALKSDFAGADDARRALGALGAATTTSSQ
jgi:putative PEP-CTERM system TPR-repeat lipoprotein